TPYSLRQASHAGSRWNTPRAGGPYIPRKLWFEHYRVVLIPSSARVITYLTNPASQIRNFETSDWTSAFHMVQFAISDFGFEMQDSSDFKIVPGILGAPHAS